MNGISGSGKDRINAIIDELFDNIASEFVGNIPGLNGRSSSLNSKSMGLPHLFVQAMNNRMPNQIEREVLRTLLKTSHSYVEALKNKTKAIVADKLDGMARKASLNNTKLNSAEISIAISEEMTKARAAMTTIVESEATKLRNLGHLVDISRFASDLGDEDPTVFFVVVKDGVTCKECLKLHLTEDGITPRLWKLSELKQGYHKRGEEQPSAFGLHPHCRCTLTYMSKGFGFDAKGRLKFQGLDYDAFAGQRGEI